MNKKTVSRPDELDLRFPILMFCNLETTGAERTEGTKAKTYYSALIKPVTSEDQTAVAMCDFAAGQSYNDEKSFEFTASYLIACSSNDGKDLNSSRRILSQLAASAAWPQFRSLYAQVMAQAIEAVPQLTPDPTIEWSEDDLSKDDVEV